MTAEAADKGSFFVNSGFPQSREIVAISEAPSTSKLESEYQPDWTTKKKLIGRQTISDRKLIQESMAILEPEEDLTGPWKYSDFEEVYEGQFELVSLPIAELLAAQPDSVDDLIVAAGSKFELADWKALVDGLRKELNPARPDSHIAPKHLGTTRAHLIQARSKSASLSRLEDKESLDVLFGREYKIKDNGHTNGHDEEPNWKDYITQGPIIVNTPKFSV